MDDVVTVVTTPDGRAFAIFVAPPGSFIDADQARGGSLGLVLSGLMAARRAGSRRWRVVVHERFPDGHLGRVLLRHTLVDEAVARSKIADLRTSIEAGEWPA